MAEDRRLTDRIHDIHIAPMALSDVTQVYALERACFTAPWDMAAYYRELQNPAAFYLVAHSGGRLAGYGGMWAIGDEAHIVTLAVAREFRRHGIGRQLMDGLLAEARRREVIHLTLEVRVTNTPAQSLYLSLGFRIIGHRRRYYPDNGEDAAVMELVFDESQSI